MIGIDLTTKRGFVAAFQERRPVLLGEGKSFPELVGLARAQSGEACLAATAVVAVPAWANDEERKGVAELARAAGLGKLRLINRPTAVALAYFALQPGERSTLLVLELEADHFDVTVLTKTPSGFDVLATDGNTELTPLIASDQAKLWSEIESAIRRVLKQTGTEPQRLDDLLCAGRADLIELIRTPLAGALGREVSTQVRPEHAVALGAAVQAGLLARGVGQAPVPEPVAPSPRSGGCLVVAAILLAAIFVLL